MVELWGMVRANPDKIETRPTTEPVKEVAPIGGMAEVVSSLVNMIQKINDLYDANKALKRANELYVLGDMDKAKDLAIGIFKRLEQLGKMPKGLNSAEIQEKIQSNKFDSLAQEVKKIQGGGRARTDRKLVNLVHGLAEPMKIDPVRDPVRHEDENKALKKKVSKYVKGRETALGVEEKQIHAELADLLKKIENTSVNTQTISELTNLREVISAGYLGEVDAKYQIDALRKSIAKGADKFGKENKSSSVGDLAKIAGDVVTGDVPGALEKVGEIIGQGKQGEKVFVTRLGKLMEGMDKVKSGLSKGLSIQESVRGLHESEIREVRSLLSSTRKVVDPAERSPYYEEKYVDFIETLGLSEKELSGIIKMANSIDVHYQREQISLEVKDGKLSVERPRKNPRTGLADGEVRMSSDGQPMYGIDSLGMMRPEDVEALYETGKEHFNEVYEELPNGRFRERNFAEQLQRALDRAKDMKLQQNTQRESFLNINMQELFVAMQEYDKNNPPNTAAGEMSIHEMIDMDFYRDHQVAKLKDEEVLNNPDGRNKKRFEDWWYQEVSFNQRGLAYEGLFERRNQSPRMQRLNSLMEIIGVGTEKKGLANWMAMSYSTIDQQNNSYVNAEFMGKLATVWTNQGVDFRLENMLKEYREQISLVGENGERKNTNDRGQEIGTISVFDAVSFLQKDIPNTTPEDRQMRADLGIPDWWKGKWGTYVYKYSETGARTKARRAAWDYFLEKELGVDISPASLRKVELDTISNKYQLMFDLAFQYSVVHKQLHMMVGNASFQKGELELPGAAAEMHLKLDPLAYPKLFAPRFQFLNVAFKEAWAVFDPGVRDYVTMAPQDYASHFTEISKGKDNVPRQITDNGSPTIGAVFLGGRTDEQALQAEKKLLEIFNGKYDKNKKLIKEGALWHWGVEPGKGQDKEMDIYLELGVYGDPKSCFRRSAGKITEQLLANKPSPEILDMMSWDKYCEITKNPRDKAYLTSSDPSITPEMKWKYFATHFGEESFNHATPSAKRSGDHPVKYGVENFNKYVEAFMAWTSDPFNQEKFDALLDVPTAVNAGMVPKRAEKNLQFIMKMAERIGRRELGGGSMYRFDRDKETGTIKVDVSHGLNGLNDNEWPAIDAKPIKNNKWYWNPVQHKSIPESVGIGVPEDSQILLDLIKGQRAKGRIPDNMYRKLYREIANSVLWERKKGVVVNLYHWAKLDPVFDWLGPQLGITGYELRKVLSESTEKTTSQLWKYLNG